MAYAPDLSGARNRYGAMASPTSWFDQNGFTGTQPGGATAPGGGLGAPATSPFVGGHISGGLAPGGGGPTPGNEQQWFMDLVGNRPWNQSTFNELAPTLQQYGFHITPPNAVGDQTKIQLPDGTWVRVGFGEGHPVWIPQGGAGAGAGGGMGQPQVGGIGGIPAPFEAPTWEQVQQTPGFQARYQMGLQGLERGAAAKGSLLSGGTQKAIARYGQEYGTNEYNNAFNRALNVYGTNVETQSQLPWNRYNDLANRGLTAALGTKTNTPFG
jgi:hypothetical protein